MPIPAEAAEIIRRKKQQYCRFADTKKWDRFDNILLPDVTAGFYELDGTLHSKGGVDFSFSSREEFVSFFTKEFGEAQVIHQVGEGELEETDDPDVIKGVWCLVFHIGPKSGDGPHHTGGGHYYETWKRKGDDWFMATLRMERAYGR